MTEKTTSRWQDDPEMFIPLEPEQLLEIRRAVAAEGTARQEELRIAIQAILRERGPMTGTALGAELRNRFSDVSDHEFLITRLSLGYPIDPREMFTLIQE